MENAITKNTVELEQLENIIKRNIGAFYEVGRALMEIRDKGLYRDVLGYETFESYCKARWDMSKMHAYRLMDSCKVIDTVKSNQLVTPTNESQTRPLARLEPDQQREAWQKAVATAPEGKVTAAHVSKVVKEITCPQKQTKPIHKPIIARELISQEFQSAFDKMVIEIKNARAMKWKTTSHKGAIELMRMLLSIAEL